MIQLFSLIPFGAFLALALVNFWQADYFGVDVPRLSLFHRITGWAFFVLAIYALLAGFALPSVLQ